MLFTYVCGTCGSDQVQTNAIVRWNQNSQRWDASNVMDSYYCEACQFTYQERFGEPRRLKKIEIAMTPEFAGLLAASYEKDDPEKNDPQKNDPLASKSQRIIATFIPQAWIMDYATEVDPEGPCEIDITEEILAIGKDAALNLKDDSDATDSFHLLGSAPEWIRSWHGPFNIKVEDAIASYFAAIEAEQKAP